MGKHLVFYDGECGFCDHAVQFILTIDSKEAFDFAPLQGMTAEKWLENLPDEMNNNDSLILIENYRTTKPHFYILGKGALRICWLIGGVWTIPGLLSFLPSWLYDWVYRLIAKNRKKIFKNTSCPIPNQKQQHRFLP